MHSLPRRLPPRSQIRATGFDVPLIEVEAVDKAMPRIRLVLVEDDEDNLFGMQPIDGLECLKAIRATPGYRDTPAVALTGS